MGALHRVGVGGQYRDIELGELLGESGVGYGVVDELSGRSSDRKRRAICGESAP